jgi:hypothetical protein
MEELGLIVASAVVWRERLVRDPPTGEQPEGR